MPKSSELHIWYYSFVSNNCCKIHKHAKLLSSIRAIGLRGERKKKRTTSKTNDSPENKIGFSYRQYWGFSSLLSQICSFLCFCTAMSADNNTKCYMCIDLTPGFLSHKSHPLPSLPPQKRKKTKKTRILFFWIIDLFYVCFVFFTFLSFIVPYLWVILLVFPN